MSEDDQFGLQVAVEDLRERVEELTTICKRIEGHLESLVAEMEERRG